jgi:hypothetical protein
VRYKTAAVLSVVLIGGMFGLPVAVKGLLLPSLVHGITPIPVYERLLLAVSFFCLRFSWLLALPIAVTLFAVAIFTNAMRTPKLKHSSPR